MVGAVLACGSGATTLTTCKGTWCHRAHCMQAQTSQFDLMFRSAEARDLVVLVSLPLLLIGSTVRDACLTR
jgi:hypothetical protein